MNGGRAALSESGAPAEAEDATPDGASNGVPVFVMLPLDSVGLPLSSPRICKSAAALRYTKNSLSMPADLLPHCLIADYPSRCRGECMVYCTPDAKVIRCR